MRSLRHIRVVLLYFLVLSNIATIVIFTRKTATARNYANNLVSAIRCLEKSKTDTQHATRHCRESLETTGNITHLVIHKSKNNSIDAARYKGRKTVESETQFKPMESIRVRDNVNISSLEDQLHHWSEDNIEVTETKCVASENNKVFIFGAVTRNSTPTSGWDMYAVYGQWYNLGDLKVARLRCCYKNAHGRISESKIGGINIRDKRRLSPATLPLWHVTCAMPKFEPRWISVTRYTPCTSENVTFIEPYYAMKKPEGHLVITVKLVYGRISPETIVTFMEAVRYMGVDKVVSYAFHDLNPAAVRVLKFYTYIGLVDYHTITLTELANVPRRFPPMGDKQYMSDEWLVQRDVLERYAGSTYVGIFDMDEFLIPSYNRSWKDLLDDLRAANPKVSHVFFPNVHYLTDVVDGVRNCATSQCTVFERHVMTSPEKFNFKHQKMLMITSRIDPTTVNNHMAESIHGFNVINAPPTEAYVRHYGKCGRKFGPDICGNTTTWVRDTSVVEWADNTVHTSIRTILKGLVDP